MRGPCVAALVLSADARPTTWHGHLHSTTRRGEQTAVQDGLFVYDAEQGLFAHAGRSICRDPLTELAFSKPAGHTSKCQLMSYESANHDVMYCLGPDAVPVSWNETNRVPRKEGGFDVVQVEYVMSALQLGAAPEGLSSAPACAPVSAQGVPWMCDCEANKEYCTEYGLKVSEGCPHFVRLAEDFGFSAVGPFGAKGSLMMNNPIATHLVGNMCNWAKGLHCNDNYAPTYIGRISWSGEELAGRIPVEINDLQNLTFLSVFDNPSLSGPIPDLNLPLLRELDFMRNNLTGPFPEVTLPRLWRLRLQGNALSGALPLGLSKSMPGLRRFWIDDNSFTGAIPYDLPFFNNSNAKLEVASISCGLSGNAWACPIQPYVNGEGQYFDCGNVTCSDTLMV